MCSQPLGRFVVALALAATGTDASVAAARLSFQWGGPEVIWGVNDWWSWTGFEPEDLHWTTTNCAIWSVPWTPVLTHELGHCFGLYHRVGCRG